MSDGEQVRSVKSAERVLSLLEHLGATTGGLPFATLARELDIPKSSLHALLQVLVGRGYVEVDPGSRRHVLGTRVWEAGQAYYRHHSIVREARAILEYVNSKVNETVQLAKLVGAENVYLSRVDSQHPLRLQSDIGIRLPAHATGIGKVLASQLKEDEIQARFGDSQLRTYTKNTIPTVHELKIELASIRRRGFSTDNEEYTPGIFCVAVPVFDMAGRGSTALSVSMPRIRANRDSVATALSVIAEASVQLSARSGARRADPVLNGLARLEHASRAVEAYWARL